MDRKAHWENIYQTKLLTEVSWYQPQPSFSFELIEKYSKGKDVKDHRRWWWRFISSR